MVLHIMKYQAGSSNRSVLDHCQQRQWDRIPIQIGAGFFLDALLRHAWGFVQFLMEDEAYTRYAAIGGVMPATRTVAALPEYRDDPVIGVFLKQDVAPTNTFEGADRALDMLGAYIERFCYGRLSLDETLERAERDINALLARLNN